MASGSATGVHINLLLALCGPLLSVGPLKASLKKIIAQCSAIKCRHYCKQRLIRCADAFVAHKWSFTLKDNFFDCPATPGTLQRTRAASISGLFKPVL